jgi:predicted nucleotidyltransferase
MNRKKIVFANEIKENSGITYLKKDSNYDIIHKVVIAIAPKSEIYLFGSRAEQTYAYNSDYDLMIILSENPTQSQERELARKIRQKLAENNIPADVILHSKSHFQELFSKNGSIVREAYLKGIRIG